MLNPELRNAMWPLERAAPDVRRHSGYAEVGIQHSALHVYPTSLPH